MDASATRQQPALTRTFSIVALSLALLHGEPGIAATASSGMPTDFASAAVNAGNDGSGNEKFVFMFQPSGRWNQTFHWKYNHANAPQALASFKPSVIAQLQASLN